MRDIEYISGLFTEWEGAAPEQVIPLAGAGSQRRYYRVVREGRSAVASVHNNREELETFVYLSRHFIGRGLPVPQLYGVMDDRGICLLEDLGDQDLLGRVLAHRESGGGEEGLLPLYRKAVSDLIRFQVRGREGLDFSRCYPVKEFDRASVHWDMNYFKYYFLRPLDEHFHELRLQEEFDILAEKLLSAGSDCFMYRDFQARNILVRDESLYYIDYQGGRRGPVHYDLVSLLFQARAGLSAGTRELLTEAYLEEINRLMPVDRQKFSNELRDFAVFRLLQVLGAYGFRGWLEGKPHFLLSIRPAVDLVLDLLQQPGINLPYLTGILSRLAAHPRIADSSFRPEPFNGLTVNIVSFSFKKGIPLDPSGHGGGHVFDCRGVENPGRLSEFREKTGLDPEVADFLSTDPGMEEFLKSVKATVDFTIGRYLGKKYSNLMICFGCTGGRHRSVYSAEKLREHLVNTEGIRLLVRHREIANQSVANGNVKNDLQTE